MTDNMPIADPVVRSWPAPCTQGLLCVSERDEGLTEVEDGAWTTVAVGPDLAERVDAITGRLRLYRAAEEEEVERLRAQLADAQRALAELRGSA